MELTADTFRARARRGPAIRTEERRRRQPGEPCLPDPEAPSPGPPPLPRPGFEPRRAARLGDGRVDRAGSGSLSIVPAVSRNGEAGQEERLRSFFDANPDRFADPPRWRLRRLVVPIDSQADRAMRRLEEAHAELADGTLRLADLATETGGRIDEVDWRTLKELRRVSPRSAQFVSRLQAGEYSPPFRGDGALNVLHAVERQEPTSRPFEEIQERVTDAFLQQHSQALDEEMVDVMLREAAFQVLPERLAMVREIGAGKTSEPSEVDEMLELLDLLEEKDTTGTSTTPPS